MNYFNNLFVRTFRCVPVCFMLLLSWQFNTAQAQEANSFLYRITGNGLSKPSFLWGTIHLQNEALFNFPDSLYHYIESADAYAMEIHPDSIVGQSLDYYFKSKKKTTIGQMVDAETLKQLKKKYQSKFKEPIENLTLAEAMLKQNNQAFAKAAGTKKMDTFMDMYLMTISQSMGKEIVGLERVEDQIKLMDELLFNKNPEYVLGDFTDDKTSQQLIKAYLNTDLNAVRNYVSAMPPEVEEPFLSGRNKLMLQKMIPAMQQYSLFTAVGLAHLPGDQGLIQLLRKAGYTVVPVYSKQKIHASKYEPGSMTNVAKKKAADWVTVNLEESGLILQMPGKPSENDVKNTGLKMHMYIDWQENMFYYIMHVVSQEDITSGNQDSMLTAAAIGASKNSSGKEPQLLRSIELNGLKGKEALFSSKEMQGIRLVLFSRNQDLYMLMVGANDSTKLFGTNANRFVQSLQLTAKKDISFITYTDAEELFSIQFPGTPDVNPDGFSEKDESNRHLHEKILYKRAAGGSTETMVKVLRINEYGDFSNDKELMQNIYEGLRGVSVKESLEHIDTQWLQHPAAIVTGKMEGGIQYELRMLKRGGRLYTVWYFDNKLTYNATAKDAFFNSFSLLPYPTMNLRKMTLDSLEVGYFDSLAHFANRWGSDDSTEINAYNPYWALAMETKQLELKPYTWASSDSALLMAMLEKVMLNEKATVIKTAYTVHQSVPRLDAWLQLKESASQLRVRLHKWGSKVYRQQMMGDETALQMPVINQWFDAFSIGKKATPLDVTKNTSATVFELLRHAPDEDAFATLVRGLDELPFTRNELPMLLKEAAGKWSRDSSYPNLQDELWDIIDKLADSTDIAAIQDAYIKADAAGNGQSKALRLLVKLGTTNALAFVQKNVPFTKEKEPAVGNFFGVFYQHPEAIAPLLPGWYKLVTDTTYGPAVVMMHQHAQDSNYAVQSPASFQEDVMTLGRNMLQLISRNKDEYYPYMNEVIKALGKLATPEADALLFDYATKLPDTGYIGYQALQQLIDHEVYPTEPIAKYSADPYWRSSLYSLLEENEQVKVMPAKYRTQLMMAEAYLYDNVDDYDIDTLIAVGERELLFMGKKYRFYLFKAGLYEEENKLSYYHAVAGPFALDRNNVSLQEENVYATYLSGDPFDKKNVDKWLKEYLKSLEEEQTEVDAPKEEE